jgi:Ankyrin repeats (3 copies)/Ankyrin repeat
MNIKNIILFSFICIAHCHIHTMEIEHNATEIELQVIGLTPKFQASIKKPEFLAIQEKSEFKSFQNAICPSYNRAVTALQELLQTKELKPIFTTEIFSKDAVTKYNIMIATEAYKTYKHRHKLYLGSIDDGAEEMMNEHKIKLHNTKEYQDLLEATAAEIFITKTCMWYHNAEMDALINFMSVDNVQNWDPIFAILDNMGKVNEYIYDNEQTLLFIAVYHLNFRAVKTLLKTYCANPNVHNRFIERDYKKEMSPLMIAVYKRNLPITEILLQSGADSNFIHPNPNYAVTPLTLACMGENVNMVKLLLAYDTDPYLKVKDKNAFDVAQNYPEILKALAKKKKEIPQTSKI